MKTVWTVARREVKALFDHPTGYILLVVFVVVNDFLFFRQAELYGMASLRPMLDLLPWILMFVVPAVTMRALAEDARSGTLEVVLAQPLTELELLLGKYLGQVLFLLIALGLTFGLPVALTLGADLHWGVIFAQYIGSAFLIAGLAAIGVWASSITPNQITAFILGVAVTFVLVLVGLDPLLVGLGPRLGAVAQALGVLGHFQNIARGLIDLRDVVYFVSLAAVFLSLSYLALLRRKLSPQGATAKRLRLAVGLLVAGAVLVSLVFQRATLRLDVTPGHAYTLARSTRDLLRGLPDIVTIKFFASGELPPEVKYLRRDVDDLLHDYRSAGHGKVRLIVRDPGSDTVALSDARAIGIPSVQFNVVGQSSLNVKEGWLGIAVQYAGETKTIPFVRQTNDLEYRLTSEIRALAHPARPAVGLLTATAGGPSSDPSEYEPLREELSKSYDVRPMTASDSTPIPDSIRVVVAIGSPDTLNSAQLARWQAFSRRGGSLLILAGGMTIGGGGPGGGFANARPVGWNALLRPYGITIQPDLVYDLASNERVAMSTQFGRLLLAYPLWVRAVSTKASAVNAEVDNVLVPWPSSLVVDSAHRRFAVPLLSTTRAAGADHQFAAIDPQRQFRRDSLASRVLAALVNPLAGDTSTLPRGRLVVVGSADMASARFFTGSPENQAFVLNSVDWLAQDEGLMAIRSKDRSEPRLAFTSSVAHGFAKYGNVIGIPLLLVGLGGLRLARRRQLASRSFTPAEVTT
ncbi:MAG TPA: Gldg family protein [Gemmatimonadales bacterium]|nr:Gldg family protein [Gemmatimonadales bacterium]